MARAELSLIKQFSYLAILAAVLGPSRFANAGQELSRNLEIGVVVRTSCTVSTESPLTGATLTGDCPASMQQRLTRDYSVSSEQRATDGSGVHEQLVLTLNF